MTEADLIHTDAKGDLYMRDKGDSVEFIRINEMEGGSAIDTVEIPSHALLKVFAGMLGSEVLMRVATSQQ